MMKLKLALAVLLAVALVGFVHSAPSERLQRLQREIDEAYEQAVLDVDHTEMQENNAVSLIEENEENSVDDELQLMAPKKKRRAQRKAKRKRKKAKRKSKRKSKKAKRKSKRKSKKAKRKSKRKSKKAKRKSKRKSKKAKRKSKRKSKRKKKLKKRRKKKAKKGKKKRKTKKKKTKKPRVFKNRKRGAGKRDVKKLKKVASKLARKTIKDAKAKAKRLISKAKNAPGSGCKKKGCKFPPDPKKLAKKGSKYLPVDMPKKDQADKLKKLGLKHKWSVDPKVLHGAGQLDIRLKDRHRKFLIQHEKNCKGPICPKKGGKKVEANTA